MNNDFNSNSQTANTDTEQNANAYQQTSYAQQGQYQQGQYQQNPYQQPVYVDESGLFNENKLARRNGLSAKIKLGDWMKADCLALLKLLDIPFMFMLLPAGSIAYFVICLILAFSSKTSQSMKTRYQANLVWAAISLGVSLILILIFLAIVAAIGLSFGDLLQQLAYEFSY